MEGQMGGRFLYIYILVPRGEDAEGFFFTLFGEGMGTYAAVSAVANRGARVVVGGAEVEFVFKLAAVAGSAVDHRWKWVLESVEMCGCAVLVSVAFL
jgi:hypothetical protein